MSKSYANEVVGAMRGRKMAELPKHSTGGKSSSAIKGRLRLASILLASLLPLFHPPPVQAQSPNEGAPVRVNEFPSKSPSRHLFYSGSNLQYICYANPDAPTSGVSHTWTVAAATLTNIVVATNVGTATTATAHGLVVGNKVIVTGSATAALNGTYYIATVPSTTTFTFTTAGVGDATYSDAGLVMTTDAPSEIDPVWSIALLTYDGSNNLLAETWAGGTAGNYTKICANRATKTGASAIFYK